MNDTTIHYVTYDPEAIWEEICRTYLDNGGDYLYPGDEKEMLLRSVLAVVTQVFAGVDNALRMATLRYAVGEYLDIYGEKRGCERLQAKKAQAAVTVVIAGNGDTGTIQAGAEMTADGAMYYATKQNIVLNGLAQTVTVPVECTTEGEAGNALAIGADMQLVRTHRAILSITVSTAATGGNDRETDEAYRERIRTFAFSSVTTGPAGQYEAAAKSASSAVIDAQAVQTDDGEVTVYLIIRAPQTAQAVIAEVEAALSAQTTRPLTDHVTVAEATDKEYTLNVEYTMQSGASSAAISQAAAEYQEWQDSVIGRAFNPDKLAAMLYGAGAELVTWGSGSEFDGGDVEYTTIDDGERCSGTITLTAV